MRRGLTSWQATSASSSLGCRQGATALLRGGSALPFTSSTQHNLLQSRRYATPQTPNDQTKKKGNKPTKEENKQRSRQRRIKRLLRDNDGWDTYVTAENMAEQLKFDKGLVDFTLKKNEEDSPHAKEFVYSATGETLSYDSLAEKLGLVSVNFRLGKDRALHLAALLKEIKELEFDYSGTVMETVHQNPDLTAEEKEWFTRFPELSGELDETFLTMTNKRLISILREIPQEETGAKAEDTKKVDRNAGRELFKFADGKEIYVGGHFEFTQEELAKYLPEGISGSMPKLNIALMEDQHMLLRTRTYSIIKELARRHRTNFLGASGKKSMVLDGPAGSGKSTALNQIVMWARMNDWLVVWIPDAEAAVGGESLEESKMERGYYYESDIQLQIAQNLLKAHSDKLSKINLKNKFKIKGFTSTDKTLKDLLQHLTENEELLTDECMYWFRRELNRVTEYPVLIAVDGYNHFYHWSDFYNPEDSARYRPRTLRAQKLTTVKWFSGHQDHGLVNGTMVCALRASTPLYSYWEQNGRSCCVTIPNYDKEEFSEVVTHFREKEWVPEEMTQFTASYLYALADGNPKEVFKLCGAT